jgi:hypothetical protein
MALAARRGWGYVQAAENGCSFVALLLPNNTDPPEVSTKRGCVTYVPQVVAQVTQRVHPDVWIVADRVLVSAPLVLDDGRVLLPGAQRDARLGRAMDAALRRLMAHGARVVVVKTPPISEPADCALGERAPSCTSVGYSLRDSDTKRLEETSRSVIRRLGPRVVYVSVDDVLCPRDGRCPAVVGGVLARFDGIHYSATFSRRIVPEIIARAQRAGIAFRGR